MTDFASILHELKCGTKDRARRKAWRERKRIEGIPSITGLAGIRNVASSTTWQPTVEDLIANDWEWLGERI